MVKVLHNLVVPKDSTMDDRKQSQRNVQIQASVSGGSGAVESVSSDPNLQTLNGQYRGLYSDKMAAELSELFTSSGFGTVVYREKTGRSEEDGYYTPENMETELLEGAGEGVWVFRGDFRKEGTRKTHWREIRLNPATITNDIGSSSSNYVGIAAAATKVRWYNGSGETEQASPVGTRTAEHGDIDYYDISNTSFDPTANLSLIFQLEYAEDAKTDMMIWDDKGYSSKVDGDGAVQWRKVFRTDYDPQGQLIVSNGLLRLIFDDENKSLAAEQWDGSSWDSWSLGGSDWQLFDTELTEISPSKVSGQVIFEDTTSSPTDYYTVNFEHVKAFEDPVWYRPSNVDEAMPGGLQTKLGPVGSDRSEISGATSGIISREEVRK